MAVSVSSKCMSGTTGRSPYDPTAIEAFVTYCWYCTRDMDVGSGRGTCRMSAQRSTEAESPLPFVSCRRTATIVEGVGGRTGLEIASAAVTSSSSSVRRPKAGCLEQRALLDCSSIFLQGRTHLKGTPYHHACSLLPPYLNDLFNFCISDAEGEGCFTMTDLYNFRGTWNDGKSKGPVHVLDSYDRLDAYPSGEFTGKWLLTAELYVTGGGKSRSRPVMRITRPYAHVYR